MLMKTPVQEKWKFVELIFRFWRKKRDHYKTNQTSNSVIVNSSVLLFVSWLNPRLSRVILYADYFEFEMQLSVPLNGAQAALNSDHKLMPLKVGPLSNREKISQPDFYDGKIRYFDRLKSIELSSLISSPGLFGIH